MFLQPIRVPHCTDPLTLFRIGAFAQMSCRPVAMACRCPACMNAVNRLFNAYDVQAGMRSACSVCHSKGATQ